MRGTQLIWTIKMDYDSFVIIFPFLHIIWICLFLPGEARNAADVFREKGVSAEFTIEGGYDFAKVLYDAELANDTLFVGGREVLFRLKLENLELLEQVFWRSNRTTQLLCEQKGNSDCLNYITMILKATDDSVFVCGSNAFDPECTWRKTGQLSEVLAYEKGIGKSPFSRIAPVAASITKTGDIYIGTNFSSFGKEPGLHRFSSAPANTLLKTPKTFAWLKEAEFVDMFATGNFMYFLFREESVEYIGKQNTKGPVYSRIARVCQNDVGGSDHMLKGQWTTYQKARLECPAFSGDSSTGRNIQPDFFFDHLQQVVVLDDVVTRKKLLAGIFNTPQSNIYGTAVCLYDMDTVHQVFQGSYQRQPAANSTWQKVRNDLPDFNCEIDQIKKNMTVRDLSFARDHQLMFESVAPLFRKPIIIEEMTL